MCVGGGGEVLGLNRQGGIVAVHGQLRAVAGVWWPALAVLAGSCVCLTSCNPVLLDPCLGQKGLTPQAALLKSVRATAWLWFSVFNMTDLEILVSLAVS